MKLQYFYLSYFMIAIMACLLAFLDMQYLSIGFKWLSFFVLSAVYFNLNQENDILFYLGIVFSGIAESMMVIGIENFQREVNICFSIYAWLIVFLLKNSVNKIVFHIKKEKIIPFVISAFLIIYLIFEVLHIISPELKNNIIYSYIFVASFLSMLFYIGILYISKHNRRYIWLLFLIISFVSSTLVGSLESLYYQNELIKQLVYIIEAASHFFLLKFLITPDKDINYIE